MKDNVGKELKKAAMLLKRGGIVVYPTESSYAIGCLIDNLKGIKRIYRLKKRSKLKALPVIAADKGMIEKYAVLDEKAERLIHNFMPGRLTLVLEKRKNVPKELSEKGLAFRIPENEIARELCRKAGKPIIATSANVSGEEAIYSGDRVEEELGKEKEKEGGKRIEKEAGKGGGKERMKKAGKEFEEKVDFVLNVGDLPKRKASTVWDVKAGKMLRKGHVSEKEIKKVLREKSICLVNKIGKKDKIICLGIEASAHTFASAIIDENCNVLAHEKDTLKTEEGGLIPAQLAEHHFGCAKKVIENSLRKAKVNLKELDLICFSEGPGIGNALRVGAIAARALSLIHNTPLLGVNHCLAHVEIGRKKTGAKDCIAVYVSGANTQIIGFEDGKYRIYGETLDIGIGNLLDTFGRSIGLGFPAGPVLDEWYFKGRKYVELPYTVKGSDLVFSGLLTAAEGKIGKVGEKDLAYSLLHNAFAMLTEVTERALAHAEKKEVLLIGGVAASKALREMLGKMCKERGAKLFVPEKEVCVDQAIMIAWQGLLEYKNGRRMSLEESEIKPKQRIEEVKVNWR